VNRATSARNTTPASGGIAHHQAKAGTTGRSQARRSAPGPGRSSTYQGVAITPAGDGFTTSIDRDSIFDDVAQARRFIRSWKKNPEGSGGAEDARELFQQFHGKASTSSRLYDLANATPADLADLGRLIELVVWLDDETPYELKAPKPGAEEIRVGCVAERKGNGQVYGTQIYFVGGDQRLPLDKLGRAEGMPRDHVMIGPADRIAYFTSKDFHYFKPSIYEHQFGEESGDQPYLGYDARNKRIYLIGGRYRVERPGIID